MRLNLLRHLHVGLQKVDQFPALSCCILVTGVQFGTQRIKALTLGTLILPLEDLICDFIAQVSCLFSCEFVRRARIVTFGYQIWNRDVETILLVFGFHVWSSSAVGDELRHGGGLFSDQGMEGMFERWEVIWHVRKEFRSPLMKLIGPRPMELLLCTLDLSLTPPVSEDQGQWALDWASTSNFLHHHRFQWCPSPPIQAYCWHSSPFCLIF